jgi:hypothetical protein
VSPFAILLLVAAAALLGAAEWGRVSALADTRRTRDRQRRKSRLHVVDEHVDDDFARSVERDLAALPTIDEHDANRK